MQKLILNRPWNAPKRIMAPGEYMIPDDIALVYARCAVADRAGQIQEVSTFREPPARIRISDTGTKHPAPENKQSGPAPENKSEVEGPTSDSDGDGSEPEALTTASVLGSKSSSRKRRASDTSDG